MMKVMVQGGGFTDNFLMSVTDAQTLMAVLSRAQTLQQDYITGKGYEYTLSTTKYETTFTLVASDKIKYPKDLAELVKVTREEEEHQASDDKRTTSDVPF